MNRRNCNGAIVFAAVGLLAGVTSAETPALSEQKEAPQVAELAEEVRGKGWIVFSAQTEKGDWDLFLMRPDGSNRRQITRTADQDESLSRFSPDGKKLLYQRVARGKDAKKNACGHQGGELVIADAGGGNERSYGKGREWASWGPDATQVAYVTVGGIKIMDVADGNVVRELPRKGIVRQLSWSPDGGWFTGTANGLGPHWNIGKLNSATGEMICVSETHRYNCTPDWMPDSKRVLYARGIVGGTRAGGPGGWAQLGIAGDDEKAKVLYAEEGQHAYGACSSPDGKYLLFTRTGRDAPQSPSSRMALIRFADTPMVAPEDKVSQEQYPNTRQGPRLDLSNGWEPHWTYAEVMQTKRRK